jgi:hypothetical protein
MRFRLAICVVLLGGFALLAIPQPAAHGTQDHHRVVSSSPAQTSSTLSQVAFRSAVSAAACTVMGRPCNPRASTCCRGLSCVFRGGSTRVGYQCWIGRSANASTGTSWELSVNALDRDDLTAVLQ